MTKTPNSEYTFNGYPLTITIVDDDAIITCKGVTGKYSEIEKYLRHKRTRQVTDCYFGKSLIVTNGRKVTIDCLEDTTKNLKFLYKQVNRIINEHNRGK